jgi:hypothetical protein
MKKEVVWDKNSMDGFVKNWRHEMASDDMFPGEDEQLLRRIS